MKAAYEFDFNMPYEKIPAKILDHLEAFIEKQKLGTVYLTEVMLWMIISDFIC